MNLKPLKQIRLPISRYLILFMVVALVPAGIGAYLSVQQANAIQRQAEEQTARRAQEVLLRELSHLDTEMTEVALYLAGWEETQALFRDATYYNYWKETRVREVARYRGLIDAVDLYAPDGKPLTRDVTLADAVLPGAVESSALLRRGSGVYLVHFHPVHGPGSKVDVLLGYVGVRMDVDKALRTADALRHASIRRVDWHLPEAAATPVVEGVRAATLEVIPPPEIAAFSRLVRHGFLQYLGYTVLLLALLAALLSVSIARPLRRLAGYLREIDAGSAGSGAVPETLHGMVNIRELENVRQALNEYKDRLLSTAATLEEKNRELLHLTYHDPLTGRYNRRAFEARLQRAIETAVVEGKQHALCYIDVDQFKVVNDTCGHVAGDELLKQVAALLEREVRDSDMLARLGGDEFGVLLEGCDLDKAAEHAEAMRLKVRKHRFVWQDKPFDVSISIGLVPVTAESANLADVLKNADAACYAAKDAGRNRVQIYREHDTELAQRYGEMQWVSRIQQALAEDRFALHGQRIRPTARQASAPPHYEVLVRLRDPDGQLVSPMAFIPAAERYNLMQSIDQWVVRHALQLLATQTTGDTVSLAINLSGQSLGTREVLATIQRAIEETGVSPANLCFEITETAAITNLAAATQFMRRLRELGCRFALDDFGSGLSSFGYLSNLEVDYIKIDGHFIKNILADPLSRSIVDSINRIGHVLGISTIAEFVESAEVAAALEMLGVDYVQGFGIHRPEPLAGLLAMKRPPEFAHAAN